MSQKSYNKRDNCFYCERKFTFKDYGEGNAVIFSVDHIIPLSKGGVESKKNTVVCCNLCNSVKSNLTVGEFIKKVKDKIEAGGSWGNLPNQSLHTVVKKAEELKRYVDDKGEKLYSKPGISLDINISI